MYAPAHGEAHSHFAFAFQLAATMSSEHIPEVVKGKDQLKAKVGAVYCGGATEQYLLKEHVLGRILCKYSDDAASEAVQERSADAAIMNKLQAHYVASKSCNVHVVPGIELNTKPYALPVQKGWIADYAQFNRWLVELVMDGTVDRLSNKWFHGVGQCKKRSRTKLDYDSFFGLAYLLLIGGSMAILIAAGQFIHEKYDILRGFFSKAPWEPSDLKEDADGETKGEYTKVDSS